MNETWEYVQSIVRPTSATFSKLCRGSNYLHRYTYSGQRPTTSYMYKKGWLAQISCEHLAHLNELKGTHYHTPSYPPLYVFHLYSWMAQPGDSVAIIERPWNRWLRKLWAASFFTWVIETEWTHRLPRDSLQLKGASLIFLIHISGSSPFSQLTIASGLLDTTRLIFWLNPTTLTPGTTRSYSIPLSSYPQRLSISMKLCLISFTFPLFLNQSIRARVPDLLPLPTDSTRGDQTLLFRRKISDSNSHPKVVQDIHDLSGCPGEICGTLAGDSIQPLLAGASECAQQDMADSKYNIHYVVWFWLSPLENKRTSH
jgi:hypothetical protein